jgi:cation diffusion facilitator family transporter
MSSSAKQAVAMSSIFASAAMVVMKLTVGLLTGSLGILSEAAHSGLDFGTAFLTWLAVRIGDVPADEQHPYGHAKFESVSALIGTGLLFVTAIGIVWEAIQRLLSPAPAVEATWYSVAVVVISMLIDIGRSRALMKVAKETGSQALEADALHFASDILSSAMVLVGLGFVALGWTQGDAVAALGVAFFVAHAGWDLGKRTVDVLVDAAPKGIAERLEAVIVTIPGVARLDMVRARLAGATVFVEAVVKVSRALPLEQVEVLRRQVAERIRETLGEAEPLVIAEPLALDDESILETVRVLAAARGLSIHNVNIASVQGFPHVSFDMEVDEDLTIAAAHAHATTMENAVWGELGKDVGIDIHIDPRRTHMFTGTPADADSTEQTRKALEQAISTRPLVRGIHHLRVQARDDGLYASCHCLFPDQASIRDVHDATERIEHTVLRAVPGMARVVVHAEPSSDHDEA